MAREVYKKKILRLFNLIYINKKLENCPNQINSTMLDIRREEIKHAALINIYFFAH